MSLAPAALPRQTAGMGDPRPVAARPLSLFEAGLADVINQLNNRLSSIVGFSELVDRTSLAPAERLALDRISEEARQAARIVRDMIHLVQPPGPGAATAHLPTVLEEARRALELELVEWGMAVTTDLDPGVGVVAGHQGDLVNLFRRLLTFAGARLESAAPKHVSWTTRAVGASVVVVQADSGPPLPPGLTLAELDYFRPADPQFVGHVELALAQRVAESCGGALRLESGPDGRAEVTVTLIPATLLAPPLRRARPSPTALHRVRVLIADDDAANRDAMTKLLEGQGHLVTVATDGVEALAQLDDAEFDAIVTDLHMPRLDGRGLYEAVAGRSPALARRFVFVTGDDGRAGSQAFLQQVPQPVVRKPFELTDLLAAISEVVPKDR